MSLLSTSRTVIPNRGAANSYNSLFFLPNKISGGAAKYLHSIGKGAANRKRLQNTVPEHKGATHGLQATSSPRELISLHWICLFSSHLARGTQIKAQCGPRTKIAARPALEPLEGRSEAFKNFCFFLRNMNFKKITRAAC